MPLRICIGCTQLYKATAAPGQRCPACQASHDQARDQARPSRQERGYDRDHELARERYLAAWSPGQACAIGGEPTWQPDLLDLAHNEDRTGYLGLACPGGKKFPRGPGFSLPAGITARHRLSASLHHGGKQEQDQGG